MRLFRHTVIPLILMVSGASLATAQSGLARRPAQLQPAPMQVAVGAEPVLNGGPVVPSRGNPAPGVSFRTSRETLIGLSDYDLQTNSSNCNRISRGPDGRIMATWTLGFEETAYPDRGTGYNLFDGSSWGGQPTSRLEASVRCGWPNHLLMPGGREFIVGHIAFSGGYRLHYLKRNNVGEDWTEGELPTSTPQGSLWPQAAVGGPDGRSVHVISITSIEAFGGQPHLGVDGHIIYHRSLDGGETWDIVDGVIPGLDSTLMGFSDADSYVVRARGETVAVGVFNAFSDIKVFKSTDNGDTWEAFRLRDFPIDGYVRDTGYDPATFPPDRDSLPTRPDAIYTSDGSADIVIDNEGKAHAFFGNMFVSDIDTTDGNTVYFPFTSGLEYWNESFGEDSTRLIADVIDRNGNDTLDVEDIGTYFNSMTSYPSAGADAAGNIYVAYSAVVEGPEYTHPEDLQNYRHVYLMASADGGESWPQPYDAINPDVVIEPDLVDLVEAVYPTLISDVGDNVEFIYQSDFRPGLSSIGDNDVVEGVFINYVSIPVEILIPVKVEEAVRPDYFRLKLQPNPASSEVAASFELQANSRYNLSLFNAMGQQVADIETASGFVRNQVRFDVSTLTPGLYLLRLQAEGKVAVARLVVR